MKIALITGGNRGLGKSIALNLAQRGIGIIFTYHSNHREAENLLAEITQHDGQASALQLDITDTHSLDAFITRLQESLRDDWNKASLDYLVNNAGFGIYASFSETTEAQLDSLISVHLKGPFLLTQKLLPLINDGGKILNISSGLTRFSSPGYAAYASVKGAMEVLTRYQAQELGARNITVNVFAPGAIETDFGGGLVRDNKEVNQYLAAQTALGRVGVTEDIGPAVAAILSEECRWLNGQRVEFSGGMFL
jgi:NAD(P)-dependent dehydrogenase (short-subunit alcohol dehydrogenase family)